MYFFFPVEAFEDHPLSALRDTLAAVRNVNFHIQLPALNRHPNSAARWRVLHSIIQDVKQGFTCPFPIMGQQYIGWTIYADLNGFLFSVQQNTAQRRRQGIVNRLRLSIQRDHAGFQAGGLYHSLHKKVQFFKLAAGCLQKFLTLFFCHRLLK